MSKTHPTQALRFEPDTLALWPSWLSDRPESPGLGWLVDAVEALPEPHRSVVEGRWWERATRAELAARMGMGVSTVKRYERRALVLLEKRLREDDRD